MKKDVARFGKAVLVVVGKKCRIEHFRVCQDHVRTVSYAGAFIDGSIAIVNTGINFVVSEIIQHGFYGAKLVTRQRLCRIDENCSALRVIQDLLQYGK